MDILPEGIPISVGTIIDRPPVEMYHFYPKKYGQALPAPDSYVAGERSLCERAGQDPPLQMIIKLIISLTIIVLAFFGGDFFCRLFLGELYEKICGEDHEA